MNWTYGVLGLAFAFGMQSLAFAETTTTRVLQIDYAQTGESETLIYLENGKVVRLDRNSDLISHLKTSQKNHEWVNVTMTDEREIIALESVPAPIEEEKYIQGPRSEKNYRATVIPTYDEALKIYKGLNRRYQSESQCYNRAHVWSWEMLTRHQVKSMKVFLFFNRKYIRRYNFEWWFHVAPYVYIRDQNGKIQEKVMDYRYTHNPVSMREWTNIFMHNNAECSEVTKYTEYEFTRQDPASGWCRLLKVPMYYYQPIDLEALDKKSKRKDFWGEWDLNNAYREAFGIHSK